MVGAAPNYDTDRAGQIHRVFEMAREFDVDIDMHLDSGASAEELDTLLVCDLTEKYSWGGRVAIGHVSKLASMRQPDMDKVARRLADSGVALTVLTATDLYLGGRHTDHNVPRNVVDLNRLAEQGVVCSVASNNILNPFTPFGDGQLLRQANMQAIVTQRGNDDEVRAIWDMTTTPGSHADAPEGLRRCRRRARRPGDAGRTRSRHGAEDRRAGAGRLQARPADRDARAGAPAQAVNTAMLRKVGDRRMVRR